MDSARKTAIVAGGFFILAAVAAIVGLALYDQVLVPGYVTAVSVNDARVFGGAFSELLAAISIIGTAVTLFPVVRRQNEAMALGYVAGRVAEAVVIGVGIISLLAIVTLRREAADVPAAGAAALDVIGRALVAVHDWTFLFGPNLALGVNTLLLASLMFASRLVPRFIAVLGLVGGPLIFASGTAVLFGVYDQVSTWGLVTALPVFAWEMTLAAWLIVRGFDKRQLRSSQTRALAALPA